MLIYPAIDLKDGRCVRLSQGRFEDATVYETDPFAQLSAFEMAGATWLHVVDLDGAKAGRPTQHALIRRMASETTLKLQTGGGVREQEHVKSLLDAGVSRVVIGSAAVERPDHVRAWIEAFGLDCICLALDVRDGPSGWEVAVRGWTEGSGVTLDAALKLYPEGALKHVLITDVSRDGVLSGPNVELIEAVLAQRPDLEIQASGGVASLDDIKTLAATGVAGAIVGRALYEKRFTLEEALGAG
ncbi:MAG: 1-(5-phosphoribosyl)-5-[(5-phosphoribosylamino)methylideneamino]imidazole-4-carboxamide isomerase [Proteobacteria bacterium]|nr:1-(5-phosphoribosyl)-5-[(5-phosphoribosylamino)methylideneamino]imidazole-4-carboxamide isomerase [Pseudomonadota bacterium]